MSGNTLINITKTSVALALGVALSGCDENGEFNLGALTAPRDTAEASAPAAAQSVQLVERDVEAPEVFQVSEAGLWDGRPSLGGVWVAHPDVTAPERVIIRNQANGSFVIGALFRRERENPGPRMQVSSDAAAALEMLAGSPAQLQVTALRREEVSTPEPAPTADFDAPDDITAAPIDAAPLDDAAATTADAAPDALAGAAAAIDAAEQSASAAPTPAPTPAPAPVASSLAKPYIQIGIFSVEDNAVNTADRMRSNGIVPTVLAQESQGRSFWRVIVGPATSSSERAQLLEQVKSMGFEDAYFVTN